MHADIPASWYFNLSLGQRAARYLASDYVRRFQLRTLTPEGKLAAEKRKAEKRSGRPEPGEVIADGELNYDLMQAVFLVGFGVVAP